MVAPPPGRERAAKLAAVFAKYDVEGNGELDIGELKAALGSLGASASAATEAVRRADVNGDGRLSFDEFKSLFELSQLRTVFDAIDDDGSGRITTGELGHALKKLGYHLNRREVDAMVAAIDRSADGEVDFKEFESFFALYPMASLESIVAKWASAGTLDTGSDLVPAVSSGPNAWHTMLAGGVAGIASRTGTAPLETIKLAAQTRGVSGIWAEGASVVRARGVLGLWAGNGLNCLRVFPTGAITCTVYLKSLSATEPSGEELATSTDMARRAGCGALAAMAANTLTYPLDIVRAKVTLSKGSVREAVQGILAQDGGWRGLYRGLPTTLTAVVPFIGIQMSMIDTCRGELAARGHPPTMAWLAVSGGIAGVTATSVVYPLDVLRRRLQIGGVAEGGLVADSTWLALRQVIQTEGPSSLFRGMATSVLKTIPAVAISASVCGSINASLKDQ